MHTTGHLTGRLKAFLRRFSADRSGAVAVMFGLAFVPLAFLSLVMIDFARASNAKQHLQEDLDAATLIAARTSLNTSDAIDAVGDKALAAQLGDDISGLPVSNGRISNATFALDGARITGSVSATSTPIIASLFIGGPIKIGARSEVVRSTSKLEIALALDTTGSMSGTKIENLRTAAKNFITKMEEAAGRSTDPDAVKIAVVPFSTTVKVSLPVSLATYNTTTYSGAVPTWLDGRAQSTGWQTDVFTLQDNSLASRVDRFKMLKQMNLSWGGCVEARKAPYDIQDDAPSSSNVSTLFTPFFWPDEPDTASDYKNDYLNDGVVGSFRNRQGNPYKYNTTTLKASGTFSQGSGYGAALTFGPNAGCAMKEVQRLSTNYSGLRTAIDGLVASGETNVPLGMMWGWHAISPNTPFADGVAYNTQGVTKIIVLMTDGDNTMNTPGSSNQNESWYHGYGYIWQNNLGITSGSSSTRTSRLNDRFVAPASSPNSASVCSNAKAKNIVVYTIGVGVSDSSKALLERCASSSSKYYDVNASASNLDAAFTAIAGSIDNLRISR